MRVGHPDQARSIGYLIAFSLLASTFSPSRTLAQLLPFCFLLPVSFLYKKRRLAGIIDLWGPFAFLLTLSVFSALVNASNLYHWLLGSVTWYGGVAALVVGYKIGASVDMRVYLRGLFVLSLIQIPVGLYQIFSFIDFQLVNPFTLFVAVGDQFGGTLLLSGRNSHVVGLKLAMATIIAFFVLKHSDGKTIGRHGVLIALLIGWVIPSAIHSFLCFVAAAAMLPFVLRKLRIGLRVLVLAALLSAVVLGSQSFALRYARHLASRAFVLSTAPNKVVALHRTIVELPSAAKAAPLVGVGLGRYSSYAALVLSGEHLASQPAFIPITFSRETADFILPYWNRSLLAADPLAHGVANQPFFTYMSLYGELGVMGLVSFLVFWIVVVRGLLRFSRIHDDGFAGQLSLGLLLFTLFLLCLFFFDNWFEDARLMVPYFLTLGILYRTHLERGNLQIPGVFRLLRDSRPDLDATQT